MSFATYWRCHPCLMLHMIARILEIMIPLAIKQNIFKSKYAFDSIWNILYLGGVFLSLFHTNICSDFKIIFCFLLYSCYSHSIYVACPYVRQMCRALLFMDINQVKSWNCCFESWKHCAVISFTMCNDFKRQNQF